MFAADTTGLDPGYQWIDPAQPWLGSEPIGTGGRYTGGAAPQGAGGGVQDFLTGLANGVKNLTGGLVNATNTALQGVKLPTVKTNVGLDPMVIGILLLLAFAMMGGGSRKG